MPAQDVNVYNNAVAQTSKKFGCRPAPTLDERIVILFIEECNVHTTT